ncbi:ABC-2 type transport system permease protein [Streptomyces sp. V3I8]|uniref:transporter n=1 Tax=Streptomyces sp. V3I8 TaxID=3042279 RepID=UPI002781A7B7|nr:transporter [Streptomyces sp. V3I8]MDQ1036980.1 ABC-2 type transport system permease protein [Streptomyces sp. V3I8]
MNTAQAATASVTPVVVRLKLALLRNGLRRSAGRRAAYIASLVLLLLLAALQLIGLIALRGHAHAVNVTVLLTAVLALGWAVMPLFFPGGDETLDPTRLVMLPLRPRPLVRALLLASLVGIGPLFALFLLAGSVVATAHGPAAYVTGVVAAVLALLVCVALARAVATANLRLLTSRKGRDLAVLSGLVIAVGAQVVNFGAQKLGSSGLATLGPAADVLRWVPPASALGAVDSVSHGSYAAGALQLALSGLALAALLSYWQRGLTRLMTSPDGSTLQAAEPVRDGAGRSFGLGRLLPAGRTGTVMERSLRYVWRDPKTKAAWATSLGIGLIVPVFNALQGTGSIYFACFAAGMLGIQMYNQFGQDTSAFWMVAMTVSSTRDAYVELRGRALALLLITLPYATLVTVLTTALLGDWAALPAALGLTFALLGAMLATGAWSSARFPYSIPQDGYKNVAPGQAGLAWISVFGGIVSAALLCAPVIALTIYLDTTATGGTWSWILLPLGTAYGAALTLAGLRLAAPRTAARLPEILAAVSKA